MACSLKFIIIARHACIPAAGGVFLGQINHRPKGQLKKKALQSSLTKRPMQCLLVSDSEQTFAEFQPFIRHHSPIKLTRLLFIE